MMCIVVKIMIHRLIQIEIIILPVKKIQVKMFFQRNLNFKIIRQMELLKQTRHFGNVEDAIAPNTDNDRK